MIKKKIVLDRKTINDIYNNSNDNEIIKLKINK